MFRKKDKSGTTQLDHELKIQRTISLEALKQILANMGDAEFIERQTIQNSKISFIYIRTVIDTERLNESLIEPLTHCSHSSINECIANSKVIEISSLEEGQKQLLAGAVLINNPAQKQWWSVSLPNSLGRSIETSDTETILYGAKDSFSEQIEQNITLIRRRLPLAELKAEKLTIGSLSETSIVIMYIEGITNPEYVSIAKEKIASIDFDLFFDSSQLAAFMEEHHNSTNLKINYTLLFRIQYYLFQG